MSEKQHNAKRACLHGCLDEKVPALEIGKHSPEFSGHVHFAYSRADNDRQTLGVGEGMNQCPSDSGSLC